MGRVSVKEISTDMSRHLYDDRLEAVMNEVKGMSVFVYFGKYEVETGEHEPAVREAGGCGRQYWAPPQDCVE